jgi:hypothetical protein
MRRLILIAGFLILNSTLVSSQNFCDTTKLEKVENIDFNNMTFTKHDTIIDKIKYNCMLICQNTKSKIFGNINKKNIKKGHWIIYDRDGSFFIKGDFKKNKKSGWWVNCGCNILFKNDKAIKRICYNLAF